MTAGRATMRLGGADLDRGAGVVRPLAALLPVNHVEGFSQLIPLRRARDMQELRERFRTRLHSPAEWP